MTAWLANLTVAEVIATLIALGVIIGGLKWIAPIIRGLNELLEDWRGADARPGVPRRPGVMERLEEHATDISAIRKQVENSHSTNLRDDLDRLHASVDNLGERLNESAADRKQLHLTDDEIVTRLARLELALLTDPDDPATKE